MPLRLPSVPVVSTSASIRTSLASTTLQAQLAVVEQEGVAGLHGLEDFRMRQMHPTEAANRFAADETHDVALGEADGAGFEFADAELRALADR